MSFWTSSIAPAANDIPLAEGAVLLDQELHRLLAQLRLEGAGEHDVPGDVLRLVHSLDGLLHARVQVHDAPRDGVVGHLVAVVDQHEEEVESGHDGRRHLDVVLERLRLVVAAVDRVGRGQDGRARVQRRPHAGLWTETLSQFSY